MGVRHLVKQHHKYHYYHHPGVYPEGGGQGSHAPNRRLNGFFLRRKTGFVGT